MSIKQCWAIAMIALIIALCFQVTNCQGGLFDSAEDEANAQVIIERARTENQIRLNESAATLFNQQLLLSQSGIKPQPAPTPLYVWVCGTIIAIAALIALGMIIAAWSRRGNIGPAPLPSATHPQAMQHNTQNRIAIDTQKNRVMLLEIRGIEGSPPWTKY